MEIQTEERNEGSDIQTESEEETQFGVVWETRWGKPAKTNVDQLEANYEKINEGNSIQTDSEEETQFGVVL